MQKIRIIPKLEIKNDHVIKGIQFDGLRKVGNPVELCKKYFKDGADQINIFDIVSSLYSRDQLYNFLDKITKDIFIPVNIAGGITNIDQIKKLLECGADRVIINSGALRNPQFISEIANIFGAQFLTVSIDVKKYNDRLYCMMDHGRENSNIEVEKWIKYLNSKNVAEIIITSIDNDGMQKGFDKNLISKLSPLVQSQLVVGGGVKNKEKKKKIISSYNVQGISAASVFHFDIESIKGIKKFLLSKNYNII